VRVLQREGYTCLEAGDGEEGFTAWQAHQGEIVLVISDVMMPKQTGWELVLAVRGTGSRCPFLVTSGFDASQVVPPGASEGVLVVAKPWTPADLLAGVSMLLG
jgi:CheY-like chemotaxis protein